MPQGWVASKWEVQDAEGERGLWPKQRPEGAVRNEQSTEGGMRRLSTGEDSCQGLRGGTPDVPLCGAAA